MPKGKVILDLEPEVELKQVSISRLQCFMACHRLYFWRYVLRLDPRGLYLPFFVGSVFHKGIELFYQGLPLDETLDLCDHFIDEKLSGLFVRPEEVGEVDRSRAIVMGLVAGYYEVYDGEPDEWEVMHIEQAFEVPMDDLPLTILAVVDMVCRRGKTLQVVEHKALSRIAKNNIEKLPFDMQAQSYPVIIERCTGQKVKAVCYNMCRKSQLRLKRDETQDDFIQRVCDDYLARPNDYFYRETVRYSKRHRDAVWRDINMVAEELLTYHTANGPEWVLVPDNWYRRAGECFNWNTRCRYYNLCKFGCRPDQLTLFQPREERDLGDTLTPAKGKTKEKGTKETSKKKGRVSGRTKRTKATRR